ncbi:hypothetical protein CN354_03355 [Bacillus cereus]|nr:hypothetical protein CN354_03355 [Bacillus cereus]
MHFQLVNPCCFTGTYIPAMKIKKDLHSFSPFGLTPHGAKKGTDRFYAWLDSLFQLKREVLYAFSNYRNSSL